METNRDVTICTHCKTKTILEKSGEYKHVIDIQSPLDRELETYFIKRTVITLLKCLSCGEPTVVQRCQVLEQTITYTSSGAPHYHDEIREKNKYTLYPPLKS